jgi:hypothetical protein
MTALAIVAAKGVAVVVILTALWRYRVSWRRKALRDAATAVRDGLDRIMPPSALTVPVAAYGALDSMLAAQRPHFTRDVRVLGPGIVGGVLRLRLCIDAFHDAIGVAGAAATVDAMALQIRLAVLDLLRQLEAWSRRRWRR